MQRKLENFFKVAAGSNTNLRIIQREIVICCDIDMASDLLNGGFLTKGFELARLQGSEGDKAKKLLVFLKLDLNF